LLLFGAELSPQQFRAGGIPCVFWNGFDLVGYFRLQHRWVRPCFVCCPGTMTDLSRSVIAGDLCLDAHLLGRVWIGTRDCQAKCWLLTSSTESVWIAAILPRFGLSTRARSSFFSPRKAVVLSAMCPCGRPMVWRGLAGTASLFSI